MPNQDKPFLGLFSILTVCFMVLDYYPIFYLHTSITYLSLPSFVTKEMMVLLHSISESLFLHQQKENNALNHKIDFFREKKYSFMYYFTLKVFYSQQIYSQIQTRIKADFLFRTVDFLSRIYDSLLFFNMFLLIITINV